MKTKHILLFPLIGTLLFASCQREINPAPAQTPDNQACPEGCFTLTIKAVKGSDTKALSLDNGTLNAYWTSGEKVGVYANGERCGQLTATADATDNTKATLSGTVTSTSNIVQGASLMLLFPDREDITEGSKWDYTGQAGAAPSGALAAKYDYATAELTIDSVNGSDISTSGLVTFQNQQSVYRFDFKVNSALQAVKGFIVSSSQNKLVTSRSYSSGWNSAFGSLTVTLSGDGSTSPYMSLRNENISADDTYSFMVTGSDDALYTGTKLIPADKLGNGKFLAPSVTLTQPSFAPAASGSVDDSAEVL